MPHLLCQTSQQVGDAVEKLAQHPIIMIDCEGVNLGQPGGILTLISVGTVENKAIVFLFDVLSPQQNAMAALVRLLDDPSIRKVMWDGRQDTYGIHTVYGIKLRNVLDLQLVELMARARRRGEKDQRLLNHLKASYLRPKGTLRSFEVVKGLQKCIEENRIRVGGLVKSGTPPRSPSLRMLSAY